MPDVVQTISKHISQNIRGGYLRFYSRLCASISYTKAVY